MSVSTKVARLTTMVALAHVADVRRSIEFYKKLGFTVVSTHDQDGVTQWASLDLNGNAQLMLARSGRPMNPGAQDVLFYLYAESVTEYREQLKAQGLAVSEMRYPFYSPRGEFSVDDPDRWQLVVAHAD